ncbi:MULTISPECIES: ribonuclease D [Thalassolituus]|jgi:ribonuclease D|uniref:Ribonuclease D n=1 Tax=Thalassolituus oleivorans MIL-1 TaxID=1298593 RepID=M5DS81_9GAMM|nr:ribonuclease D [Thalassolituus oleivorans]PCI48603.1 MAG: ribonuclease D [Oceanospirillales bacterium]PHQ87817.1 MAG: ribonuclease D [Thalassobium sp.]AHK15982.1 ribonuclease D [Thalassolituus oleivorans R6-15]APR67275.1 ribonuclease D [Thalassolituus oleivorans]MCA6127886.1 hypothetical protein [Thalassolituus oleivorans 4BN06-13]
MSRLDIPEPLWIADHDALTDACRQWLTEDYLAVDTEFVRTTTFYPQAGLIQIAGEKGCYLIDPLLIKDWTPFVEVLQAPTVLKVFHACAEDLEVCRRLTGVIPRPLADSQLGIALAGHGGSMGFQRAVMALLEIDLPKEETRSNWLHRPLRPEQVDYAVADVHYLYQLYPVLRQQLRDLGREEWLAEDCTRLLDASDQIDDSYLALYRKVKLAWKLRPQEQYILQQLTVWREQEARNRDVPRNKVVDDNSLWNIARFKAKNRDQLVKAGVKPPIVRDAGNILLKIVETAMTKDEAFWPEQLDRPLSPIAAQSMKDLKDAVTLTAEQLNIPTELLANKRALEFVVRSGYHDGQYQLPEVLSGWRKDVIGQTLLLMMTQGVAASKVEKSNHE